MSKSNCTISYHVDGCDCPGRTYKAKPKSFVPLFKHTETGKVYVLQSTVNKLYVTERKGKRSGYYFGLYIGQAGKRYGAARFDGGPKLNAILQLTGNADLIAIEVDK